MGGDETANVFQDVDAGTQYLQRIVFAEQPHQGRQAPPPVPDSTTVAPARALPAQAGFDDRDRQRRGLLEQAQCSPERGEAAPDDADVGTDSFLQRVWW